MVVIAAVVGLAPTGLLWSAPSKPAAPVRQSVPPGRDVAVTVGGGTVSVLDVFLELNRMIPQESYHGRIGHKQRRKLTAKALRNAILVELQYQVGKKAGMSASNVELKAEFGRRVRLAGGRTELARLIRNVGLDRASYDKTIMRDLIAGKYRKTTTEAPLKVTEQALRAYHRANPKRFILPESAHFKLIEVRVEPSAPRSTWKKRRKEARNLRERLLKGEDFSKLARKHSGHPSAAAGGDLGWVHKGSMSPDLEAPAFALQAGQFSTVLRSLYGYDLVLLVARRPQRALGFNEINKKYWTKELQRVRKRKRKERADAALLKGAVIRRGEDAVDRVMRVMYGE